MSTSIPTQPLSALTLRVAEEGDKRIWVNEPPNVVVRQIEQATKLGDPLVTFFRIRGLRVVEFSTQPGNVVNIEDAAA